MEWADFFLRCVVAVVAVVWRASVVAVSLATASVAALSVALAAILIAILHPEALLLALSKPHGVYVRFVLWVFEWSCEV